MLDIITELAWQQHGAFSTGQATRRGVSRSWIFRHHDRGTIVWRAPAVYALGCAPATPRQELMVQVLAAGDGALATGASALGLWTPELALPLRPIIAVPRGCGYRTRRAWVVRSRDLHLAKPTSVDGIPTVGVARALLDASAARTPDEVVALINACQRHSSLAFGELVEALHIHARQGRPGIVTFRTALSKLTTEVPDSEFERLVVANLIRAGVDEPRLHHLVRLPGASPIELDLDWPGVLLDIELDGRDHFVRMKQARRDRQRDRLLQAADYVVARYTWDEYLSDRDGVIREISAFLDQCRSTSRLSGS